MPDVRTVTDSFAVAPQILPEDAAELAQRFVLLINNRPDGEAPGQPSSAEMEAAAREAGVAYVHIPIAGAPDRDAVAATRAALSGADGRVLAFCRSGTRSIVAWGLAEAAAGRSTTELEALGARAGYELGPALRALLPGVTGAT